MKRFVTLYGGTDLPPPAADFVALLARTLLEKLDVTLVTGGFARWRDTPEGRPTDRTVADAATAYLEERGVPTGERLETWLPEAHLDGDRIDRFHAGTIRRLEGKSVQAHAFMLVNDVSAVVTVSGGRHTRLVLDLAFAIGRPVLPVAFTGGESGRAWEDAGNRRQLESWFGISPGLVRTLRNADAAALPEPERRALANDIVEALRRVIHRRCLVLMRYDEDGDRFYDRTVAPAIQASGFVPVRIDRVAESGDILGLYEARLEDCDGVVADVTNAGANPNVMYELGYAHSRNIRPLLFARTPLPQLAPLLPVYLRDQSVKPAGTPDEVRALAATIRDYLAASSRPALPASARPP